MNRWVIAANIIMAVIFIYVANQARLVGEFDRANFWLLSAILTMLVLIYVERLR